MAVAAEAYVQGGESGERTRLLTHAACYDAAAGRVLDELGARPGWRVLDVGCGGLGLLPVFAARVAAVTALEPEAGLAEAARAALAARGIAGVAVVHGELEDAPLPTAGFDLVHARLLLRLVRNRARTLDQLTALARPGGLLLLQEVDVAPFACQPPHPAWARLLDAYDAVCRARGLDAGLGRRLPGLLRAAGLLEVEMRVSPLVSVAGEPAQRHLLDLVADLREAIVDHGLLADDVLDDACAALAAHLARPGTVVVQPLLVQAWGRVPA